MSQSMMDKIALTLGYVPKADLEQAKANVASVMATSRRRDADWEAAILHSRRQTEILRVNARALFQTGVDAGAPRDCPTSCDHKGRTCGSPVDAAR